MAVTEIIEIIVREEGSEKAAKGIEKVGKAGKGAAAGLVALVAVLATVTAARGLAGVAVNAIKASAAFDQYEARLRLLLGSQEEANKAVRDFNDLSTRAPFATSAIAEGAATLATVAVGNREKLQELTETTANLAAVTGLSFEDAAKNLTRSLQRGIGASEEFQNRGVRKLIESILEIPDATKLSAEQLDDAFSQLFGGGGTFGDAAENLSLTLSGAFQTIENAATNVQVALGDAFTPVIVNTARAAIVPFLNELKGLIDENQDAITEFAQGGVRLLAAGFLGLAQGGLAVLQAFDQISNFVHDAVGAFVEFRLQLAEFDLATAEAGNSVFLVSDEILQAARDRAADLRRTVDDLANSSRENAKNSEAYLKTLDGVNERLALLKATIDQTDLTIVPDTSTDADLSGLAGGNPAASTREQEAALSRIESITDRLRVADAKRIDPLDAQLEKLRQQQVELEKQALLSGNIAAAAEGVALIESARADIEQTKADELQRQADLQASIVVLIAQAADISPALAEEIRLAADEAVRAGGGLEAVNKELEKVQKGGETDVKKAVDDAKKLTDALAADIKGAIGGALRGAITGEGFDAMALLADTGAKLLESSFNSVLEGLSQQLAQVFSGKGGAAGGASGISTGGSFDFGAGVTAALGAGLSILAGSVRDTTSSISNNLIRSAATQSSEAATRGVIAGPTNIPIFQVGESIESAFVETNGILTDILQAIQVGSGGSGGGAFGGPGAEFDTTSPSLA